MKIMLLCNAANSFASLKSLTLLAFFIFAVNSCKKEIITGEEPQVKNAVGKNLKLQSIGYQKFVNSINAKQLGVLQQVLTPSAGRQVQFSAQGELHGLIISTDSVKNWR